ncbi:MAG TPA: thioredoxin family protein [Roseiflexaceae bacterium]
MLLLAGCGIPARSAQTSPAAVITYDPARDAARDIQTAIDEAQRTHQRILLEVGGDWCVWCHHMDRFYEAHSDLQAYRDQHFIPVKVNYSQENQNEAVLSHYPEIPGYPHLFVLDSDGALLRSQNTSPLESGDSYNLDAFFAFLRQWAAP